MIYEILPTGAENAITARELAAILGISKRQISVAVEKERRAGFPICADCDSDHPGYYIPETRGEMIRYCSRLKHRAGEIFATRRGCLKSIEKLP